MLKRRKEENVLFNDPFNTFLIWLYDISMLKKNTEITLLKNAASQFQQNICGNKMIYPNYNQVSQWFLNFTTDKFNQF